MTKFYTLPLLALCVALATAMQQQVLQKDTGMPKGVCRFKEGSQIVGKQTPRYNLSPIRKSECCDPNPNGVNGDLPLGVTSAMIEARKGMGGQSWCTSRDESTCMPCVEGMVEGVCRFKVGSQTVANGDGKKIDRKRLAPIRKSECCDPNPNVNGDLPLAVSSEMIKAHKGMGGQRWCTGNDESTCMPCVVKGVCRFKVGSRTVANGDGKKIDRKRLAPIRKSECCDPNPNGVNGDLPLAVTSAMIEARKGMGGQSWCTGNGYDESTCKPCVVTVL